MSKTSNKNKNLTIEAVAKKAGVSTMTVSRVLRGTGNVTQTTTERVMAAMDTLGYVHNKLAGALASSVSSSHIAVIVPSVSNIVFTEVLAGVASALEGTDFQPVVGITEYNKQREYALIRSMLAWRPAAFVLAHPYHHPAVEQLLINSGVPVIELMAYKAEPIDMCYGLDHAAVGAAMATHLLSKGYMRFGYLGSSHRVDLTAKERFDSFKHTIESGGGTVQAQVNVDKTSAISLGREHMGELIAKAPEMEIAYFSNDAVAAGAMMHCMAHHIRIPEQLALASFSGLEIAAAMPIPITTIKSPRFDMGKTGGEKVLAKLKGGVFEFIEKAQFEMVDGEST